MSRVMNDPVMDLVNACNLSGAVFSVNVLVAQMIKVNPQGQLPVCYFEKMQKPWSTTNGLK